MCTDSYSFSQLSNVQSNPVTVQTIMENMDSNTADVLEIKKLGGGSLVDFCPIFSRDGG